MEQSIKKEKSCGAVIYRKNKEYEFLIIKQRAGHYGFPKGHVENNETEIETATREIKEETNLDVEINPNFRHVSTYSPFPGVIKDVIYFIATPTTKFIKVQESEVSDAFWCKPEDAMKIISYEDNKRILRFAFDFLEISIK